LVLIKICFVDVLGVFESVVMVVFYLKNVLKYIFYFLKIIFDINILKLSKNIKKKLI